MPHIGQRVEGQSTQLWQFAPCIYPKTFEEKVEGAITKQRDRFIEKWPRPKPIAKGVTLAFRIVAPWSSVTSSTGEMKSDIIWIPNAPKPKATEIDVIITAQTTPVSG